MGKINRHVIDSDHLHRQKKWSLETFGPGDRTHGIIDHITKEFVEVLEDPTEWIDIVILALDGCWRGGMEPQEIIDAIITKQGKNERRVWPDWRQFTTGQAIEHDRSQGDG